MSRGADGLILSALTLSIDVESTNVGLPLARANYVIYEDTHKIHRK